MIQLYSTNTLPVLTLVLLLSLTSIACGKLSPFVTYNSDSNSNFFERPPNSATSSNYGNKANWAVPNVSNQRAPLLRQQQPPMRTAPLLDPTRQQTGPASQQNLFRPAQSKLAQPQRRMAPASAVVAPQKQYKQSGGYYEHNKSTDHVKAYNFDNQQDYEPASNQWQFANQAEPVQEAEAGSVQYDPMAQEEAHTQMQYENVADGGQEYEQQQYPDYGYDNTSQDNEDTLEDVVQSTAALARDDEPTGNDDEENEDSDDDEEPNEYERRLESELMKLKMERLNKKKQKPNAQSVANDLPGFGQLQGGANMKRQAAMMPMSTNIAIYNTAGPPASLMNGASTEYLSGANYQQPLEDEDDIIEDENDKFITSPSGIPRPRFVDPVRLGYLDDEDDDYVDADKTDRVVAPSNIFVQPQQQQQQQQVRQATKANSVVTSARASASASSSVTQTQQQQPLMWNSPVVRPGRPVQVSGGAATKPLVGGTPQQTSQRFAPLQPVSANNRRRFKRSLYPAEDEPTGVESRDAATSEKARHKPVMVTDILKRVKRCGGDDDDGGDANSVRRGRWGGGGRRVNKSVKKTSKRVKSGNKKSKKSKTKVVKKIVTTKVIKNGQVQSVQTSEHSSDGANNTGSDNNDAIMVATSANGGQNGGCDQNNNNQQQQQQQQLSQSVPAGAVVAPPQQPVGQSVYIQTTPGKEVHTTSQTSMVVQQGPVQLQIGQAPPQPQQQQPQQQQPQQPQQQPQQQQLQQTTTTTSVAQPAR